MARNKKEIDDFEVSVPATGLMIGKSTQQVYTILQKDAGLRALLKGNRWMVSRTSIRDYLAAQHAGIEVAS